MRAGTRLLRKLLHRRLGSTLAGGKVYSSPAEAVADVPAGAKLLVGGFGLSGCARTRYAGWVIWQQGHCWPAVPER